MFKKENAPLWIFIFAVLIALAGLLRVCNVEADASNRPEGFLEMEATAYCVGTTTADGSRVREGIAAMKKEWIGLTAIVYLQNEDGSIGDFVGYYEIKDTGGDERIKEGKCIDIYMKSYDDCIQFGRKKVLVKLINGEG